ncbi:MAG: hypothetical protein OXE99_10340 [Cellvibrionales bacterium]|nr:hypothetical protein [Cellvibrionales bacterium]
MRISKSQLIIGAIFLGALSLALIVTVVVLSRDNRALLAYNAKLEASNETLLSELASLQGQVLVKEQAYSNLRESLDDASQQSITLNRQLEFYKLIMSPDEKKQGLSLYEHFFNTKTNTLHLTFINIDKKHQRLSGKLKIDISGVINGKQKTYPIDDLLPTGASFSSKLSFKYFDTIEQRLQLPDGFHPEKLALSADLTKKPFSWQATIKWVSEK